MSLKRDREPVEVDVFKGGRRRSGLKRVTRFRVHADGSLCASGQLAKGEAVKAKRCEVTIEITPVSTGRFRYFLDSQMPWFCLAGGNRYLTRNSARAAARRLIKDINTLGLVEKEK